MTGRERRRQRKRLSRAVAVQRRRLQEHGRADCPNAGIHGPCPEAAREQRKLVGLWRALRELGEPQPELVGRRLADRSPGRAGP